jgi:eukaryotic-like serine/threonine-protein kinase
MMSFGGYRPMTQLGAGTDGISYRGLAGDGVTAVEIRDLTPARRDASRWARLVPRVRLAEQLDDPAALRVIENALEHDSPYVVMEWAGTTTLTDAVTAGASTTGVPTMELVRSVSGALMKAHRLGLAHGELSPSQVLVSPESRPKLDFSGLLVGYPRESDSGATVAATGCDAHFEPRGGAAERSADLFGLGSLITWLLRSGNERFQTQGDGPGADGVELLRQIARELTADDEADRLTADLVHERLARFTSPMDVTGQWSHPPETIAASILASRPGDRECQVGRSPSEPFLLDSGSGQLGRYRLLEKIGEGGQGVVYRALDPTDGAIVAIKVLRMETARNPDVLKRLRKEARLMAEANSPFVVNLLEYNEDGGIPYLVLEFVAGRSLGDLLAKKSRLDPMTAISIMAGVSRGLMQAHERGIIHRDIKPANILLIESDPKSADRVTEAIVVEQGPAIAGASESEDGARTAVAAPPFVDSKKAVPVPRIKISDFGLARHVVDTESLALTAAGALMGTPHYMAPEQWTGRSVDSRTDVYAIGATLFHVLTGRPPFTGETRDILCSQHCNEPPPFLRAVDRNISEGLARVVETAMSKRPEDRFIDAGAMLRHLENLLHGEPSDVAIHPRLPECDPREVIALDLVWDMAASPRELWPFVSNTERVNRAIGVQAPQFSARFDPGHGVRRFARMRRYVDFLWEEHPFEWVEPRRFGTLREFQAGLVIWFMSELEPTPAGGTRLTQRIRIRPRGLAGKILVGVEARLKMRKTFERVYRRIDAARKARTGRGSFSLYDPFEDHEPLPPNRRLRLEQLQNRLTDLGVDPVVVECLGEHLARGGDQEVARIRPLALAERFGLDPDEVISACLHSARVGMLLLQWDLLCPVCRISCGTKDTMRAIAGHARCEACNREFPLDFANSIELIFRVHPEIRQADLATYCIGGPAHSPHVFAQIRLAPGERIELNLDLPEGSYRLRGPQLPWSADFQVRLAATVRRYEVDLASGPLPDTPDALKAGGQVLILHNSPARELLLRVERIAARTDALTAARAASLALFRELFPAELLAPGQLATVSMVTLLVISFDTAATDALYHEIGDARAFSVIHGQLESFGDAVRQNGGAVVKTTGDGLLASFSDLTAAVRAALDLNRQPNQKVKRRRLPRRAGLHRGTALAATINDHLDYFGTTARDVHGLLRLARSDELILSQAVAGDPEVAALLLERQVATEVVPVDLSGHGHVIRIPLCEQSFE